VGAIDMAILGKKPMEKRTEYKICILGDDEVGKTSLIRRYTENKFEEGYTGQKQIWKKEDLYVSIVEKGLPHSDIIALNIWDWVSRITEKQSYINAKGALLVCDLTDKASLRSLKHWKDELYKVAGEVPIVVVGNKIDLKSKIEIRRKNLQEMAKKFGAPYIWTSAKSGKNVDFAFYKLAKILI
jgi:small GTP-binding protein